MNASGGENYVLVGLVATYVDSGVSTSAGGSFRRRHFSLASVRIGAHHRIRTPPKIKGQPAPMAREADIRHPRSKKQERAHFFPPAPAINHQQQAEQATQLST